MSLEQISEGARVFIAIALGMSGVALLVASLFGWGGADARIGGACVAGSLVALDHDRMSLVEFQLGSFKVTRQPRRMRGEQAAKDPVPQSSRSTETAAGPLAAREAPPSVGAAPERHAVDA